MSAPGILVVNRRSNDVAIIDPEADEAVETVAVGPGPRDAVYSPATDRVFITFGEGEVAVLDLGAGVVIATVGVGLRPLHIYEHPTRPEIWVANDGSASISVIDLDGGQAIATIPAGDGHHKIAFTADGELAFATNIRSSDVTVIDTRAHTVSCTVPVGKAPHGIAATADGARVLVANNGGESVSVIGVDRAAVIAEIPCPRPNYVGLSPDGDRAWAVCATDQVAVIDLASLVVVGVVHVGEAPDRVVFGTGGDYAFVNNTHSGSVSVIDARNVVVCETIPVEAGGSHQGMAFSPDRSKLYVANHGAGSVSILDALEPRFLKRVAVGDSPATVIAVGEGAAGH